MATAPSAAKLVGHELVMGVIDEILQSFASTYRISSLTAIEIMPGEKDQALHRDNTVYPIDIASMELTLGVMWSLCDFTEENGGLWRRLGMALVRVGTVAIRFDPSGVYRRTPKSFDKRAAFIFDGIANDEIIGNFGFLGGGASGGEIGAADPMHGTPPHTLVVASSEKHSENTWLVPDETGLHHSAMD
jgi:hypothetical protein